MWILLLVYKTGLVEQIDDLSNAATVDSDSAGRGRSDEASWLTNDADAIATSSNVQENHDELWKSLSANHWPMLFAYYNISLTGRWLMLCKCFYCAALYAT